MLWIIIFTVNIKIYMYVCASAGQAHFTSALDNSGNCFFNQFSKEMRIRNDQSRVQIVMIISSFAAGHVFY